MKRLIGLDLFRAVALFGMLVAHVGPAAWTASDGFGTVYWGWEIFHSRMPAMFAFAAGLSLNLGGNRSAEISPRVWPTVIRAALLTLIGVGLSALGTPVAVILAYFGLWFVLVLPFRRLHARGLWVAAAVWAILGPIASFLLRSELDLPDMPLVWGLVSGDYPALTWMPFMLAGLAAGRLDLSAPLVRRRLRWVGGAIAVAAYGLSALFLAGGGAARIMETLTPSGSRTTALQEFARLFFRERGVTDEGSWLWLFAPGPHSGSWADVWGCLGVCLLLLGVLLPLGDWAAKHPEGNILGSLTRTVAAPGAMVLSVYTIHIVVMAIVTQLTGHSYSGPQSVATLAAFTVGLTVGAAVWLRWFRRGPLEAALAAASRFIEQTGTRVFGGSKRRSQP